MPAIWTQLRGWKRDLRRATMQVYNIAMHCLTLAIYSRTGALNPTSWKLFAIAAPLMLIASFYGARIYKRFSERGFADVGAGVDLRLGPHAGVRRGAERCGELWRGIPHSDDPGARASPSRPCFSSCSSMISASAVMSASSKAPCLASRSLESSTSRSHIAVSDLAAPG